MLNILDFEYEEIAIGTGSLPLNLPTGTEVALTSIFLNIPSINVNILFSATVGWETQLLNQTVIPSLIFRIRRGGSTTSSPIVFQTNDAQYLPDFNQFIMPINFNSSFDHSENPIPSIVGTFQQYFLTVQNNGIGSAAVIGPVNLSGMILG
ncbi:hypothetical protein [Paenibacillus gorillae]|uniref:hypothetical protein n=1 Tax=Paenibacillus gorillae TaxID=1243662 RepID=UPI0004AC7299|nr:hypothetical protein [Paenibacillus gorillae]